MLKKILVPLDGSDVSESALGSAIEFARQHQSEVLLLQVVDHYANLAPGLPPELGLEIEGKARVEAKNYLESCASRIDPSRVSTQVSTGIARDEIVRIAEAENCGLIIFSSHGRDGVSRWLLGSVAEGVLRRASCPVLLVRGGLEPQASFRHILVPVDGSEASLSVLERLPALVATGGKVSLLQSSGVSLYPNFAHKSNLVADYLNQVEADLRAIRMVGLVIEPVVLDGNPVDDILTWSSTNGCDLIAMSSHGRSGFQRFWLGSVSEKVARHATCSTLIFPPGSCAKGVAPRPF